MKQKLIFLLFFFPFVTYAQNGVIFKIETLTKPEQHLRLSSQEDILKKLILSDVKLSSNDIKKNKIDFPYQIVASSKIKDSLVDFGYHAFFNGMYQAYADHRPFVLSPDMIWLLISQGFARHVHNNAEELRSTLVGFDGKISLVVENSKINLNNPNSPWEKVFSEFTKQIGKHTGYDLVNILSGDFTTTTPASKVASQITIMEATRPYFDFVVLAIVCGIPEVILEGKPEDWEKVLYKAKQLRQYKLDWWIDEIEPVLIEMVKTSKGAIDTSFWRNMFKYHSLKKYGSPKVIDGWIVKFFPYNKEGKRNNLKEINGSDQLPNEIVKVDVDFIETGKDGKVKKTPLELWSGFFGLQQDKETFTLKPQIGWMIKEKDVDNKAVLEKLKLENAHAHDLWGGINIRVKSFPNELLQLEQIKTLEINFIDEIQIPDAINKIKIGRLILRGKISNDGIERIRKLLPVTIIIINGIDIKPINKELQKVDERHI